MIVPLLGCRQRGDWGEESSVLLLKMYSVWLLE